MSNKHQTLLSLTHRQPERIPIDLGATSVTGIHVKMVAALREHFNLEPRLVKVHEPYQMLGLVEEDLQEAMGVTVEGAQGYETLFGFTNENWKSWRFHDGFECLVSEHFHTVDAEDGGFLIFPKGDRSAPASGRMPKDGYFFDSIIRQEPIDDANLNVEDNLQEFGEITDEALDYYEKECKRAAATGRAVVAGFGGTALGDIALVPAPFLTHPKGIRDVTEWYMSTLTRQDYIHEIFDRQTQIAIRNLQKLAPRVKEYVDVVFICGTDFGTQNSTFCSVDTFQSLYQPYYKRVNDWIHANTEWKTFKHSCGAVYPLIPSLIDSGFDILNPVQCSAEGMDPQDLKNEFGKDLVFWGGGVDTQTTLMFGTPQEVREQVLERCEIFGKDGGFVFNTVHNIQGNVPMENVIAMVEALKDVNG